MARQAYSTDLTDAQWALIEPFLRAWKSRRPSPSGHEGRYEMREIVNALFYQNRTGCQWALLPHDLPPGSAAYYYFGLWRDDGTDQAIHDLLRCQARERAGRAEDPTAVVLDTQSIRAANHVPAATTGKDAGKKVPGRKRGLAVDVLGLIIAVVVTAASATDNTIGVDLLDKVVEHTPTVTRAWVDAGFKDEVMIHGAVLGITVEQVRRNDQRPGFVPVAKRWVVEQVHGTLMLHRRLVRDYETLPASTVSHTLWASTANLTRRLTGTTTPTWRDTRKELT
ncbi:MAG TPA: IS5 family transposase [Actinoplanes sp.]|nr:IS5 family transposase [Actinoplanes sp.]